MPRIREHGVLVAELVEEGVDHRIDRSQTLRRRVLEQLGDEINRIRVGLAEHLAEGVRLDLGEFVLHVVGVHGPDLLASRRTQHLDDLDQLVYTRLAGKQGLTKHQLCHDASSRPNVYHVLLARCGSQDTQNRLPILVV